MSWDYFLHHWASLQKVPTNASALRSHPCFSLAVALPNYYVLLGSFSLTHVLCSQFFSNYSDASNSQGITEVASSLLSVLQVESRNIKREMKQIHQ